MNPKSKLKFTTKPANVPTVTLTEEQAKRILHVLFNEEVAMKHWKVDNMGEDHSNIDERLFNLYDAVNYLVEAIEDAK